VSGHPAGDEIVVYSTPWCGWCKRLERVLEHEGIAYRDVDIEADPAAAEFVMSVNRGNATVPTVLFPDGTVLTNPTREELLDVLRRTA
jgi:mycoredoxin